ncbi:hypothetical protein ACFLRT_03635, partial [Acidobacteriota bacterium]
MTFLPSVENKEQRRQEEKRCQAKKIFVYMVTLTDWGRRNIIHQAQKGNAGTWSERLHVNPQYKIILPCEFVRSTPLPI